MKVLFNNYSKNFDMKAPDKVYITRERNGVIYSLSFNDNGGLEYIRKDALLEWAKEKIAKGTIDEWDKGYVQCLKDLIEKLESFR